MMLVRGLATAIGVVVLDQLSKAAVRGYFAGHAAGGQENVTSFFNIVLIHNRGMSFGLFNGGGGLTAPLFSLVAAAIVTVLIYWLSRVGSPLLATAIGLIIGGAIGFGYAKSTLPEEVIQNTMLAAMYGSAGAITAILAVRLSAIIRLLARDIGKKPPPDDSST